jgi:hypothetical protein
MLEESGSVSPWSHWTKSAASPVLGTRSMKLLATLALLVVTAITPADASAKGVATLVVVGPGRALHHDSARRGRPCGHALSPRKRRQPSTGAGDAARRLRQALPARRARVPSDTRSFLSRKGRRVHRCPQRARTPDPAAFSKALLRPDQRGRRWRSWARADPVDPQQSRAALDGRKSSTYELKSCGFSSIRLCPCSANST